MALQRAVYRPRDAEHTVLHQVIAEHLEAFLEVVAAAGGGAGLPQFVEREFPRIPDVRRVRTRRGAVSVRGLRARAPGAVFVLSAVGNYLQFPARRRMESCVKYGASCG